MKTPLPTEWIHKADHECRVNSTDVEWYRAQGFELGRIERRSAEGDADVAGDVAPSSETPPAEKESKGKGKGKGKGKKAAAAAAEPAASDVPAQ